MDWIATVAAVIFVFLLVYRVTSRPSPAQPRPVVARSKPAPTPSPNPLPKLTGDEDDDVDPTQIGRRATGLSVPATKIVYDEDAALDEPTQQFPLIAISAAGRSDKGLRRRRNEDSLLMLDAIGIFAVADGMGGYLGGEVASKLAVATLEKAFATSTFEGPPHDGIPPRASELARAIQMANEAILHRAASDRSLDGMGTTICAARFSPKKQRLYVGHVGDSRLYCLRDGRLTRMTSDHTMADYGVAGAGAGHLSRAVGIWPTVPVDVVLGKPRPGDRYLLCSDGLTKELDDGRIEAIMRERGPREAVDALIDAANEHGGKDNITVLVIGIEETKSSSAAA